MTLLVAARDRERNGRASARQEVTLGESDLVQWGRRMTRLLAGAVLLVASALKFYGGVIPPLAPDTSLPTGGNVGISSALLGTEAFLGMCLLLGFWQKTVWYVGATCFAAFLFIAVQSALSGSSSCGCFGRIEISPWFTVVLDAIFVSAFLAFAPAGRGTEISRNAARPLTLLGLATLAGVVAGSFFLAHRRAIAVTAAAARIAVDGTLPLYDGMTVLEPEKWIGKSFPIFKHVDISPQLAAGNWIVLIYHHNCPVCREAIPEYEQLAKVGRRSVALIEMPPFASKGNDPVSSVTCLRGKLSEDREWFAQTPLAVALANGIVVSTASGEGAKTPLNE